jgi:hypothetical protein
MPTPSLLTLSAPVTAHNLTAWFILAPAPPPAGPAAAERAGTTEEESLPPRTRLRRRRGDSAHLVECFDTAVAAAVPVHVTVLAP